MKTRSGKPVRSVYQAARTAKSFLLIIVFATVAFRLSAQTSDLIVQTGHSGSINSIAFNFDGSLIASGSDDNTIKIWDVETGREIRTLSGNSSRVRQVAFSSVENVLVSAGDGDEIIMWDVNDGRRLWSFTKGGQSVAMSPDGKVAAAGVGGDIVLFEAASGKELERLQHSPSHAVSTLSFSPDGGRVVSGSYDGTVKCWEISTSRRILSIDVPGNSAMVKQVLFSPDGKSIFNIGWNQIMHEWDAETGRDLDPVPTQYPHIDAIAVTPDSRDIATAFAISPDTIAPESLAEGPLTIRNRQTKLTRGIKTDGGEIYSLAFSPDGKTLAAAGFGRQITLYDVANLSPLRNLTAHSPGVGSVAFSYDGKLLATGNGDRSIKIWPLDSLAGFRSFQGNSELNLSVSFTGDGQTVATGGRDDAGFAVDLWNVATGEFRTVTSGEFGTIRTVAFSRDGKKMSGTSYSNIYLWNNENGQKMTLHGHESEVWITAFSPDSKLLASASTDHTGVIWDVETGKLLVRLVGHTSWVDCVAFSPDGKTLATGSEKSDGTVRFWDVATGREKVTRRISTGTWVHSITFSPDGTVLASDGDDGNVRLWNASNGKEIKSLTGHKSVVNSVSFSPSGKLLASASTDGTVKLWDVAARRELCTLIALDKSDWAVTTPDGRFDTSKDLDNIEGLHWVVSDDPLKPLPLEIFMKDYYEPQLLPRLLACTESGSCNQEFKSLPAIGELNRVQPRVTILKVTQPDPERRVKVTVRVERSALPKEKCRQKRCETLPYDLRLFRDGRLVGTFPNTDEAPSTPNHTAEGEKAVWRKSTEIEMNNRELCTAGTRICGVITFQIQLPKAKVSSQVEFAAYAFNDDRIKSRTDVWRSNSLEWPAVTKESTLRRRAYIISVGINAPDIGRWNLNLAVKDTRQTQRILTESLRSQYDIVPISLVSDFPVAGGNFSKDGTKENIRTVFDLLAGRAVDDVRKHRVPAWQNITKASPDDAVFISFSSHGYVDDGGVFFILPSDIRMTRKDQSMPDTDSMISSDELAGWLRDVDAGEMVMIIDSCYAEASVTGTGFKPAPMGSRGLGQLAYDKQMRILTATRQKDTAIEERTHIQQGLLTAALMAGIDQRLADFKPAPDGKIFLAEWLEFAVDYVPKLYEKIKNGEAVGIVGKGAGAGGPVLQKYLQTPVLFDFRRNKTFDLELTPTEGRLKASQ